LDEFTKEAMTGLTRGDSQIPVGNCATAWDHYEKGKLKEMGLISRNC